MKFLKISMFGLLTAFFTVFAAISCKKTDTPAADPCAAISCQNGGTCLNGTCSCPTGYEGSACEKQKTPKAILIKSITVTKFPATTSSGGGWDLTSGPDVYPTLTLGSTALWTATTYFSNAVQGTNYKFDLNPYLRITDLSQNYGFNAYDYDNPPLDSDDFMGGVTGKIYSTTNGFPKTMTFSCSACETAFEFTVDYEF